jgi:hypothetical protein
MPKSPSRRQLAFGAAFFLAASIGCLYTYRFGLETGTLRLGSRSPRIISLLTSPEQFQFWLNASLVGAALFASLALISVCAAFCINDQRVEKQR